MMENFPVVQSIRGSCPINLVKNLQSKNQKMWGVSVKVKIGGALLALFPCWDLAPSSAFKASSFLLPTLGVELATSRNKYNTTLILLDRLVIETGVHPHHSIYKTYKRYFYCILSAQTESPTTLQRNNGELELLPKAVSLY